MSLRDKTRHKAAFTCALAVMLTLSLAVSATGCLHSNEPEPEKPTVVVNPKLERTIPVDAMIITSDVVSEVLSPDGGLLLAAKTGSQGSDMLLIPIMDDSPHPTVVDSVPRDWLVDTWFDYRALGWLSEAEFLYAKMGWQPTGAHKGERGSCIVLGTLTKEESGKQPDVSLEEIAFIPLSYHDSSLQIRVVPEKDEVYMNNNTTMWKLDVSERTLSVLKDDLPDYLYRQPIPSPNGDFYVYELNEGEKSGIFIFDTKTRTERPLLPTGDTISFYPAWSYDGKYIAAYTVERKPESTGTSWQDYLFFEGEDGPLNMGSSITVVDTHGNIVEDISVEGKYLRYFVWAHNQDSLAFLAGLPSEEESLGDWAYQTVVSDSVWVAKMEGIQGSLTNLGSIPKDDTGSYMEISQMVFDAGGNGIYGNVYDDGTWHFSGTTEPTKVAQGPWTDWVDGKPPIYGNAMVGLVDTKEEKKGFFLFDGSQVTQFGEFECHWAMVVGFNDEYLIIFAGNPSDTKGDYLYQPESGNLLIYDMLDTVK